MAEDLTIDKSLTKEKLYESLIPQIEALMFGEDDLVANVANAMAALKEGLGFFWVGVYFVKGNELVLGPFQGPVACTRIAPGKGVCGTSWSNNETIIVPNVDEFPGHIACATASKSEIVIPGKNKDGEVAFILDVDSDQLDDFDSVDEQYLTQVVSMIESKL